MSTVAIAGIVFVCVLSGAVLGMFLRAVLPEPHLSADSKDVIKQALALLATMSALVLGLLIASAKTSYDTRSQEIITISTNVILLDWVLRHYGPEANTARTRLREAVMAGVERIWPSDNRRLDLIKQTGLHVETLYGEIEGLSPRTDAQRATQTKALQMALDLAQTRVLQSGHLRGSIPIPFMVVLTFWLFLIFLGFGLFAPTNATVIAILVVCALSVSTALFLIVELDRSFDGLLQVSSAPLRAAIADIQQ